MSKTTENYGLTKPEVGEFFSLETWNGNMDKIDEQMKTRENATDALQEPEFTVADKRENIASKEKMPKILGKIAKFFADLKVVAFTGSYKDLTDKPSAATQTADGMLSATDKKAIDLLGAPIGSCATGRATAAKVATLKNFKLAVGLSIAVKFTDTAGTANPASGNLTLNVNGTGAKTIGYFRNGSKSALTYASGAFFCNNATHIFTYDGVYWLCMDWNADNNTTYANFVKSGTGAKAGLVPAPSTTAGTTKYLREDGTWAVPPDTKTSIINNQTTTKAGYALDARQANPNIDGTLAKQVADLNGSLNNNRDIIWSGINTLAISAINSWVASDKTITLQPGKYILGFKASTVCKNNVYLETSIDTKEYTFPFFEKKVNVPIILITDAECTRSVSNAFVAWVNNPVELHFFCYASAAINITYELWALRLI